MPAFILFWGFLLELTPFLFVVLDVPFSGDIEGELDPVEGEVYFQAQLAD